VFFCRSPSPLSAPPSVLTPPDAPFLFFALQSPFDALDDHLLSLVLSHLTRGEVEDLTRVSPSFLVRLLRCSSPAARAADPHAPSLGRPLSLSWYQNSFDRLLFLLRSATWRAPLLDAARDGGALALAGDLVDALSRLPSQLAARVTEGAMVVNYEADRDVEELFPVFDGTPARFTTFIAGYHRPLPLGEYECFRRCLRSLHMDGLKTMCAFGPPNWRPEELEPTHFFFWPKPEAFPPLTDLTIVDLYPTCHLGRIPGLRR
jgi:hypothetical protein